MKNRFLMKSKSRSLLPSVILVEEESLKSGRNAIKSSTKL